MIQLDPPTEEEKRLERVWKTLMLLGGSRRGSTPPPDDVLETLAWVLEAFSYALKGIPEKDKSRTLRQTLRRWLSEHGRYLADTVGAARHPLLENKTVNLHAALSDAAVGAQVAAESATAQRISAPLTSRQLTLVNFVVDVGKTYNSAEVAKAVYPGQRITPKNRGSVLHKLQRLVRRANRKLREHHAGFALRYTEGRRKLCRDVWA